MANLSKRLETNVDGNFFVDSTCIDCDTCRQLAPATFVEEGDYSVVFHQPESGKEELAAYQASIACPVGSIGTVKKNSTVFSKAQASFPQHVEDGVYYAGFNSEKSFGANSYFIQHPEGNWLIDSPRYLKHLVQSFEEHGGLRYIFLSHEDDVADASRYAKVFGAIRIIHRADVQALPDAEWVIDGPEAVQAEPGFVFIPVPGHTAGSMVLLYKDQFLFSGDHLWWDRDLQQLGTPERLVWDNGQLEQSVRKLLHHSFEWVLPGHGERIHLDHLTMKNAVDQLIQRRWNPKHHRV
ncbi:MAG: MBL fold metallo-hydrolase [Nitrospirae bacterium]|nr:MBL fold metallo-hydrolase [Nitrospirota bacterium]